MKDQEIDRLRIPDSMRRWKELSDVFFLAALCVSVIAVTGSVLTFALFMQRAEVSRAQIENPPVGPPLPPGDPPPPDPGPPPPSPPGPPGPPPPPPPPPSPPGPPGPPPPPPPPPPVPPPGGGPPPVPPPGGGPPPVPPPGGGPPPPPPGGAPPPLPTILPTPFATPMFSVRKMFSPAVLRPLGSVAAIAATASAAATGLLATTALPTGFSSIFRSFFPFFATHRRRARWGRVVEEQTNLPVAGAVITILDISGKPKDTVTTKSDGTFAMILPQGTYRFVVQRAGFTFAASPRGVFLFPEEQLYTGGIITVEAGEKILPDTPLVLALTPTHARYRTFRERVRPFLEAARVFHARVAIPLLLIAAAMNSLMLWLEPSPLLVAYEILYGVLLTFELLLSRVTRRAIGNVRDAIGKHPVNLAIVRLLDTVTKRVITTRVTSPRGSFLLLPPPGRYRLQVVHPVYVPYLSDPLRVRGGKTGSVRLGVELVRAH